MNRNQISQRSLHKGEGRTRPRSGFYFKFPHDITRWFPLLLIVITFGVYFQNLFHEFTYDDKVMVLDDPAIWQTDIEGVWSQGGAAFWLRQIRTLTFMADYAIFGFSPTGYHLHNLFWHLLCVLLVFFLLKKISQQDTFSFFGALIFAIHPIQVEAVSNITNRKEMLALGFLLIAFLCYIRFLEGTTAGKWGWLLSSVLAWVIATFSKQVAIVLPPLLVTYEFLFVPRDQRFLTRNIPILFGLIVLGSLPLLLYAVYALDITNFDVSKALERTLKGYRGELTYIALVATSARAFWTYFQLLVWPAGLCPNHLVDLSPSFLDFKVLVAWFGLIAFILFSLWVSSKWPVLAFGMLWFTISFIPISNWLPSAYILADRYMYMPSVGYCLVLVAFGQAFYGWLVRTRPRRAILIASFLAVALTIGYTSATLAYNHYWSKQELLMPYMLQCNPISPQAHEGLGYVYLEEGIPTKAVQSFSRSIELGNMNGYSSRGNAYYQLGQYQAAIKDYNQAIALRPEWVRPYNNRGTVFYEMGEYEAALKDYNHAISRNPKWGEPYYNRGILYLALNQYDSAARDFTQALDLFLDKSRVYNARGLAFEKQSNWAKAQEDYQNAISSDPSNAEAFFNLGRVQLHNDELDEAILSYQKSKELGWEKADNVLKVLRKKGYLQK